MSKNMKTLLYFIDRSGRVGKYDPSSIDSSISKWLEDSLKENTIFIGIDGHVLSLYYSKGLSLLNKTHDPGLFPIEEKLDLLFNKYIFLGTMHTLLEYRKVTVRQYNEILPLWEAVGDWTSIALLLTNGSGYWDKDTSWDERIPFVWEIFARTHVHNVTPVHLAIDYQNTVPEGGIEGGDDTGEGILEEDDDRITLN